MEIQGYPNYLIYQDGKVWSKHSKRYLLVRATKWKPYPYCCLCKDGKETKWGIHRLIALHYIENPHGYKEVDHINRDINDYSIDNLRWVNRSINCHNKTKSKSNKSGHKNIHYCKTSMKWKFKRNHNNYSRQKCL